MDEEAVRCAGGEDAAKGIGATSSGRAGCSLRVGLHSSVSAFRAGIDLRQPNEASACPAELAAPDGGRWGTPAARAALANNDAGACLMQGLSTGSDRSNIQIYS